MTSNYTSSACKRSKLFYKHEVVNAVKVAVRGQWSETELDYY
ncbi:MAG: hypothetical protein SGI87_06150 [Flavobacteriales bacterium]|nr:hypothetical protein [Flavobacteriales bacterium]